MKELEYQADGIITGHFWGGGIGFYYARKYTDFKSLDDLKETIKKDFKSGAIDSGFGFEKIIGARMKIDKINIRTIDGDDYVNVKHEIFELGDMSEYYNAIEQENVL